MIETGKIKNFDSYPDNAGRVSSGLSSYGIDVRVGYKFRVFTPTFNAVIDPKAFDPKAYVEIDVTPDHNIEYSNRYVNQCSHCGLLQSETEKSLTCKGNRANPDHVVIPPHGFALAETIEWFDVPRDVLILAFCKSTYARCGILISPTVMEPEWRGSITVEISNTTPLPAKVYAGEGIAQLIFLRSDERLKTLMDTMEDDVAVYAAKQASCGQSYADKNKTKTRYQDQSGITPPSVKKGGDKA